MGIIEEAEKYLSEYRAQQYNTSFGYLGLIERLVDRLKESQHLADVMETMIPLTVCDEELKVQWRKLLAKYNGEGDE